MDEIRALKKFLSKYKLQFRDFSFISFMSDKKRFNFCAGCKGEGEFEEFKRRLEESGLKLVDKYKGNLISFVRYGGRVGGYDFVVYVERWEIPKRRRKQLEVIER